MHILMTIPAFLAYVFVISLRFFGRRERNFVLLAFAGLGIGWFLLGIWHQVDQGPFQQADRKAAFFRLLIETLRDLPGRVVGGLSGWLHDQLGAQGTLFALVALGVLTVAGVILFLLHRNAADPD